MLEHQTDWVCDDCCLAIGGYSDHETGRPLPEPYSREEDSNVYDVVPGLAYPAADCGCELNDEIHFEECRIDSARLSSHGCDSCGTARGEYFQANAVTVTRRYV